MTKIILAIFSMFVFILFLDRINDSIISVKDAVNGISIHDTLRITKIIKVKDSLELKIINRYQKLHSFDSTLVLKTLIDNTIMIQVLDSLYVGIRERDLKIDSLKIRLYYGSEI
jgi:hypothetical protein